MLQAKNMESIEWIRLANKPALRVTTEDGKIHRFGGFKEEVL